MAAGCATDLLIREASCPICLDFFTDPVTTECGHNFCRRCLARCCWEAGGTARCPHCRLPIQQRNARPNRHLANIVEIVGRLPEGQRAERQRANCVRHQEPLRLFCKNDEVPICVVCDRAREHQGHSVVPIEEVSEEYKEKIKVHVKYLKEKREQLEAKKSAKEIRSREALAELQLEKENIRSVFEKTQKVLEKTWDVWFKELENLERAMRKRCQENITETSDEIAQLSALIAEMERKCWQPACEFLQNIKTDLRRYEENFSGSVVELSPGLDMSLEIVSQKNAAVRKSMQTYKEYLESILKKDSLKQILNKVNVTPGQKFCCKLMLCDDQRTVGREWAADFFLGNEKFRSGRHYWKVEVDEFPASTVVLKAVFSLSSAALSANWAFGVARDSVRKNGKSNFNCDKGFWALGAECNDLCTKLLAFTSPKPTPLTVKQMPKKIQVVLDYEADLFKDPVTTNWAPFLPRPHHQMQPGISGSGCLPSGQSSRSARELQAEPAAAKCCRNYHGAEGGEKWGVCATREESLKLFCRAGQAPACLICDRSRQHHGHRVLPVEEASQESKEEIRNHLKSLKKKADKLKEQRWEKEQRIQRTVTQLELEKQEVRSAFERMQKFLEEKQHLWLDQLEELEKREGELLTDLSQEISQLSLLMTEMEEKLVQNITNCLSRCEKNLIQYVMDLPPKLEERLRIYAQKISDLKKAMQNCEVRVTLDPDTACHKLFLSKDLKTLRWDALLEEKTDNPERCDHMNSVLGHRNFTSGRHWWEVEVQGKGMWEVPLEAPVWAIGVARDTVTRKGDVSLDQKEGIWAVGKIYLGLHAPCQALAFTSLEPVRLTLRKEPGKIWVALHYEEGWVDFFDANTDDFIFTFHVGSFSGQRI